MKKLMITLALAMTTQAAFAYNWENGNINIGEFRNDGKITVRLEEASHYSNGTYNRNNTIILQVSKKGKVTGLVGSWLEYRKGSTLENGQKAKDKKSVLAEANMKSKAMCTDLGGEVITTGQQVAKSELAVPAGEFYRLFTAYSEVTCDLTNKSAEIIIAIDEALSSQTPEVQVKLLEARSNLLNQ